MCFIFNKFWEFFFYSWNTVVSWSVQCMRFMRIHMRIHTPVWMLVFAGLSLSLVDSIKLPFLIGLRPDCSSSLPFTYLRVEAGPVCRCRAQSAWVIRQLAASTPSRIRQRSSPNVCVFCVVCGVIDGNWLERIPSNPHIFIVVTK